MTIKVNSVGRGRWGREHLNFLVVFESQVSQTGLENSDTLSKKGGQLSQPGWAFQRSIWVLYADFCCESKSDFLNVGTMFQCTSDSRGSLNSGTHKQREVSGRWDIGKNLRFYSPKTWHKSSSLTSLSLATREHSFPSACRRGNRRGPRWRSYSVWVTERNTETKRCAFHSGLAPKDSLSTLTGLPGNQREALVFWA